MSFELILKDEKRKICSIMKKKYVPLKFSQLHLILDNNLNEPRWMNTYILLYKASLPKNIVAYDILLQKLSKSMLKFYFKTEDEKRYIVNADEKLFKAYVWYLTTKEDKTYKMLAQYIPPKDYIKEIMRFSRFEKCGLVLENVDDDEFMLSPIGYNFKSEEEARMVYEKLFDAYELFTTLKLNKKNFLENFYSCLKLGSDKKMLAVLSTMISYFDCKFLVLDDVITLKNTNIAISDEATSRAFESHMMDVYHFYRNVINTKDKRDIVSEVCNKKVSKAIMKDFSNNISKYSNIVANNKGLVEWIITISRESKYKLHITVTDNGVFFIDGTRIANEHEAELYYIDYMENKSNHVSLVAYKSSIISKIKKIFSFFKFKFWKKEKAK
jgi:hypothetical protein